jgi:hypothetical protein
MATLKYSLETDLKYCYCHITDVFRIINQFIWPFLALNTEVVKEKYSLFKAINSYILAYAF